MTKRVQFDIDLDEVLKREANVDKTITFRLSSEEYEGLKSRHNNVSYLLRQLVRDFISAAEIAERKKKTEWTR